MPLRRCRGSLHALGFAVATLFISAGCGPSKLLEAPSNLPAEVDGRKLWHTPNGYIYATRKDVAGETDRWIVELKRHVERTYHRDLGKGLVVVIDGDEKPFVGKLEELVRLQRQTAIGADVQLHEMPDVQAQRQKLAAGGMTEDLALRITPFELDGMARSEGGLPHALPEDAHWAISCPSQSLMEQGMWEFGPKSLENKKGKAFAVATAWAWPLAFAEAAKGFRLGRDVLVFELWTIRQDDWDRELRHQEIAKYTEERALVISPTLALALKLARGDSGPQAALPVPPKSETKSTAPSGAKHEPEGQPTSMPSDERTSPR